MERVIQRWLDVSAYFNFLVSRNDIFGSTGQISFKTGSTDTEPSFKGIIGALSLRCQKEGGTTGSQWGIQYALASLAETKFIGLWYFD